jgi:hypothetical protein
MNLKTLTVLDGLGRPILRLVGVAVLAAMGAAVAFAFWRWAMGATIPDLPGSAILLALVPQIPQVVDQITRTFEKQAKVAFGTGMANPHGGPAAP